MHVSGSAGTSFCHWARRQGWRAPTYNCILQCKGPEEWLAPWLGNECRDGRSCAGLRRRARHAGLDFASVETMAPHWLRCAGVRYSFLMAEPVKRVLTYAHRHCERRGVLNARCDAAATLRRWYDIPLLLLPPRTKPPMWARGGAKASWSPVRSDAFPHRAGSRLSFPGAELEPNETAYEAFFGTSAISNYNVWMLLGAAAFFAPLHALGDEELAAAKQRLRDFAFASTLPLDEGRTARLGLALDGTGALLRKHFNRRAP